MISEKNMKLVENKICSFFFFQTTWESLALVKMLPYSSICVFREKTQKCSTGVHKLPPGAVQEIGIVNDGSLVSQPFLFFERQHTFYVKKPHSTPPKTIYN